MGKCGSGMGQVGSAAYRAVLKDSSEAVRAASWAEVCESLNGFETSTGFVAPFEVLVVAGSKQGM